MTAAIGVDVGTSGVRGVVIENGSVLARAQRPLSADARRLPEMLLKAVEHVMAELAPFVTGQSRLAIAGTSGSVVFHDGPRPRSAVSLYCDRANPIDVVRVADVVSPDRPVHGATSPLARAIGREGLLAFEPDWIAGRLADQDLPADVNSALKAGADPATCCWPDEIKALVGADRLPRLVPPGTELAPLAGDVAARLGFRIPPVVVAGTTDGCAAALAAGLRFPGDAVTSLGSTLTLKVVSERPVTSPTHGVYSHRLLGLWLVGGASNAGGSVVRAAFPDKVARKLSARIDPAARTGLSYVPLPRAGERFPVSDPDLAPRLAPRPEDDALFLQGILEALVDVEASGYALLTRLGTPPPVRVFATGGGTRLPGWMALRRQWLSLPHVDAPASDPAFGAARLAIADGWETKP